MAENGVVSLAIAVKISYDRDVVGAAVRQRVSTPVTAVADIPGAVTGSEDRKISLSVAIIVCYNGLIPLLSKDNR